MELRAFAERVLFGDELADKLVVPRGLVDLRPGAAVAAPGRPGRPAAIPLDFARTRGRTPFPGVRALDRPGVRGRVLHFFANHELLALELMALALLRFPEAPAPWRAGLGQTMVDEQRHMRLYLDRMAACGVELGEVPVNSFFWRALADMQSPLDFVTHMSLTFEQANLDHALFYRDAFAQAGDAETAGVLRIVHREEIGHVKHGLVWFRRLREPGGDDWQAYTRNLRAPFTPSRARGGAAFDREGRRQAGFDESFIDEVEVHALDLGRPPVVRIFHPTCEEEVARGGPGYSAPAEVQAMQRDLELLPALLSAAEDVVLVRRRPDTELLKLWRAAGLTIPRFVEHDGTAASVAGSELAGRPVAGLDPWGWSPTTAELLAPLGAVGRPDREIYSTATSARLARAVLAGLPGEREWLVPSDRTAAVFHSVDAAAAQIDELRAAGHADVVCKAPFSSSGQGRFRLLAGEALDANRRGWMEATLSRQGALIVGPWHDVVADLSLQLEIDDTGEHRTLGLTTFATDRHGQYLSTWLGDLAAGLPAEVRPFLLGGGRRPERLQRVLDAVAAAVAAACNAAGHAGPAGVDLVVVRVAHDGAPALRLHPLLELNPRTTMGRVALAAARHVRHGCGGHFQILGRRDLAKSGATSFAELAARLQREHPVELTADGRSPRIARGFLPLADPARAEVALPALAVGTGIAPIG